MNYSATKDIYSRRASGSRFSACGCALVAWVDGFAGLTWTFKGMA